MALTSSPSRRRAALTPRRAALGVLGLGLLAVVAWQLAGAQGGTPNPNDPSVHLSHGAVVLDSGLLVLREGLESILVLAAVTAGLRGESAGYRRPIGLGGALAFLATVATWFIAIAITNSVGAGSLDLQAATGLLAIVVLLVVMNWFFHKVYWTGWISNHNQRRKRLVGGAETAGVRRTVLGLGLLGFTSVYREGFEVVLFLQNLRLRYGSLVVLEGVALGLVLVAAIGYLTFALHRRLPYRRMLVVTGILLGGVLLVMVGESMQELQQAGWIGTTSLHFSVPGWMSLWFSIFPNLETVAAQGLAAVFVIGSYLVAERLRVRRPRRRAEQPPARSPIVRSRIHTPSAQS